MASRRDVLIDVAGSLPDRLEWHCHGGSHLHHFDQDRTIIEMGRERAQIDVLLGWVGGKWTSRDVLEGLL